MKRIIAFSLLGALAICGCQVKEMGELASEREAKVFTAIIEDNNQNTKTSLDNNGNVLWKQGDQVSIFVGSTINEQYQVNDESDGETSASLYQVTSPGFVAGTDINNNVAFYPYSSSVTIAKSESAYILKKITLPSTQNYAEGSFGNGAFPMTAVTSSADDMRLKFKNVLGGLKLQLTGTAKIASISVTGNSNEILCGSAEVTVSNGSVPSITLTDASAKTVTLDCGGGVQLTPETAKLFIIALPPMTMEGGFTVVVSDTSGGQMEIKTTKPQTFNRSNLLKMPAVTYEGTVPEQEHQYVDLGLPSGLEWATCNVGANSPEEYGDYYAWGEIEPYYSSLDPLIWKEGKTGYDPAPYQWCNGSLTTLTKYNTNSSYGPVVDNILTLELADDAARANWGGSWRMPTDEEWTELRTKCTWTWTTQNGVDGMLVTGPNGNSIFLPAAGYRKDTSLIDAGSCGYYWSSSLNIDSPLTAWNVYFDLDNVSRRIYGRYFGQSVRPVLDEGVSVSVSGISLEETSAFLELGQSRTLTATVFPEDATNKSVTWESSNPNIASVSKSGVVTGHHIGSTTITATTTDGGFTASCEVKVWLGNNDAMNVVVDLGEVESAALPKTVTAPLSYLSDNTGIDIDDLNRVYESPVWISSVPDGMSVTYDSSVGFVFQFENGVNSGYGTVNCVYTPKSEYAQLCGSIWCTIGWHVVDETIKPSHYLTLTSSGTTTIQFKGYYPVFYYSFDKVSWQQWDYSNTQPALGFSSQHPLYLCGDNPNGLNPSGSMCRFYTNGDTFEIGGNIMSLINYSEELDVVPPMSFQGLFEGCSALLSAPELPANQLGERCYLRMFAGCTSLVTAPVLPAATLSYGCYSFMFNGCTNLSKVQCLAENVSSEDQTNYWLSGVASTGTFIKNPAAEWTTGESGIPEGWTLLLDTPTPEAVDLGLPSGLKWATCNVGANSPEEYGDYFAWGETEPYYSSQNPLTWKEGKSAGYAWTSYPWCNGSQPTLTKYNTDSSCGAVDNKTTLDLADDVARVNWGGNWRMPTDEDWVELVDNCTWNWTTQNGVNGRLVTGPNGSSIFLPAAGGWTTFLDHSGSCGSYWSSSLSTFGSYRAWGCVFYSNNIYSKGFGFRYERYTVRPVTE